MASGVGDLEAVVIDRLWVRDGATAVRAVCQDVLHDRQIADTTVMSTMGNLHRKEWLSRERRAKGYLYWPRMIREHYSAQLMRDALDAGGWSDLVLAYVLEHIGEDDSAALRKVLRRLSARKSAQ
ncbi:MAG: BlaI/MecI/CopY family transcriptional regulator [Mycobacterium sp.]|nr:BlaI/MecI/CopY family transcriptional regulator [Mycobacterium sp.]